MTAPRYAPAPPDITWRRWPGRIIVSRPPCTGGGETRCRTAPSVWIACACGQPFAACGNHRRDLQAERAVHWKTCPKRSAM